MDDADNDDDYDGEDDAEDDVSSVIQSIYDQTEVSLRKSTIFFTLLDLFWFRRWRSYYKGNSIKNY